MNLVTKFEDKNTLKPLKNTKNKENRDCVIM